jgi:hypothetical protein
MFYKLWQIPSIYKIYIYIILSHTNTKFYKKINVCTSNVPIIHLYLQHKH